MLTEPIIDIIVYGYPAYLPISIKEFVYTTTDNGGHVYCHVRDESTNISPSLDNGAFTCFVVNGETNVLHSTDLNPLSLLHSNIESNISLLDTRDYYDWIKDYDEKWSDNLDVINSEYIRGAGSLFNMILYGKSETNIKPSLSLNAKVGILFDWNIDADETWNDNPNVTNQDYIQTLIG